MYNSHVLIIHASPQQWHSQPFWIMTVASIPHIGLQLLLQLPVQATHGAQSLGEAKGRE